MIRTSERAGGPPSRLATPVKLELAGSVTAEQVDKLWRTKSSSIDSPISFFVDLSEASFIELTALLFLNSFASAPRVLTLDLILPKDETVLDFLKVWRFVESVEEACGRFRGEFLSPSDIARYRAEPKHYANRSSPLDFLRFNTNWTGMSTERRNFFEIASFRPGQGSAASLARKEAERWVAPAIIKVLNRHLDGRHLADSVSKVVVYEAISNAIRHPDASVVQVASAFYKKTKIKALESTFQLCIWDNGKSIASTLQEVLDQGGEIQSKRLPEYMYDQIRVDLNDVDAEKAAKPKVIRQDEPVGDEGPSEARLLLASTFPEVSRRHFFVDKRERDLGFGAGMGLYALTRTVLDQYQGKLFMRSGCMHLHMECAHDAYRKQSNARYKCKIRRHPEHARFTGNLLRVSIPLVIAT